MSNLWFNDDTRIAGEFYTQEIDGEIAIRAIYNPAITHPWAHFSTDVVAFSVNFFDRAFGEPVSRDRYDQIWQLKAEFNALGVVGFFMFLVALTFALLVSPGSLPVWIWTWDKSLSFCLMPTGTALWVG